MIESFVNFLTSIVYTGKTRGACVIAIDGDLRHLATRQKMKTHLQQ